MAGISLGPPVYRTRQRCDLGAKRKRVVLPVCRAGGGVQPDVDLNDSAALLDLTTARGFLLASGPRSRCGATGFAGQPETASCDGTEPDFVVSPSRALIVTAIVAQDLLDFRCVAGHQEARTATTFS